jgi:gamma-glutamyl-gamma-aminobutyraldehyde dehydrogenase
MSSNMDQLSRLSYQDWRARAANLKPDGRLFIDGERRDARDGRVFESINPATGEVAATVARGAAADVDAAVAAAARCFREGSWALQAPRGRLAVLYRFAELIEEHAAELALLDVVEMGKPITDTISVDMPETALTLRFYGEAADKLQGTTTATEPDVFHYTLREPLGVVGAISPWNYPLWMASWKFAPALAAGNSVVLKPAEQASLSCLRAAELFVEAGGPPGAFNVVAGYGEEAGQSLARHMDVVKITFTGSTDVGKLIMKYSGESNLKRVAVECGGKSPHIFFADLDDLDRAVDAAVEGIFGNMGEVCNAGSRILVQREIYEDFVERFCRRASAAFRLGDPLHPETTLGPLVDRDAAGQVREHIAEAKAAGARLVLGGEDGELGPNFVPPTAFADVTAEMRLARQEVFGPVAAFFPFADADEAIAIANDTVYGLAAGIWTGSASLAHRMVRAIEAGTIWVNSFNEADMTQPFGGYKQSGHARDKCLETLLEYTQVKSAWMRLR